MLSAGIAKLSSSEKELKARAAKSYLQKASKWVSILPLQRNATL